MTTPIGFSTYLCDRNDAIDNAAYALARAIYAKKPENDTRELALALINALAADSERNKDTPLDDSGLISAIIEGTDQILGGCASDIHLNEDGRLEWNMNYIGEINDCVEDIINDYGIAVCHPFYESDEDYEPEDGEDVDENAGIPCYRGSDCGIEGCPLRKAWGIIIDKGGNDCTERHISREYLAELCDARDKLCGFCEADECENCIVTRLIDDAYNEVPDEEDDE